MNMNLNSLRVAVGVAVFSASSIAGAYQYELGGSYQKNELDFGYGSTNINSIDLFGKVHFADVKSTKNPLKEDAYLAKSNNFGLAYGKADATGFDFSTNRAMLEFYVPSAMLYLAPFYLSISDDDYSDDSDNSTFGLSLGITPVDGLRVTTTWSDDIDYEINLAVKYVVELGGGKAMNLEAGYGKSDDSEEDDYFGLGFDYYIDKTFSIGAFYDSGLSLNQFISDANIFVGEDSYGIRSTKFVNDNVSIFGSYSTSSDIDNLKLGANWRF